MQRRYQGDMTGNTKEIYRNPAPSRCSLHGCCGCRWVPASSDYPRGLENYGRHVAGLGRGEKGKNLVMSNGGEVAVEVAEEFPGSFINIVPFLKPYGAV